MNQIPESARRRMQAQDPALAKTGPERGTQHPDADLLTAFAEHSLGGEERERVLLHLAACAECREVVSLALPEKELEAEVVAPAAHGWFRWPMLRWTAVAAAVVVVWAAVAVLTPQKRYQEIAAPATSVPAGKPEPPKPAQDMAADQAATAPAKTPAMRDEARQSAEAESAASGLKGQTKSADTQSQNALVLNKSDALARANPAEAVEVQEAAKKKLEMAKEADVRKDMPAATAAAPTFGGVTAGAVHGVAPASPPPAQAGKTENLSVRGEAATFPLATVQTEAKALRQAESGGPQARAQMSLAKARSEFGVRWRIAATGAIESSADGKTWNKVEVDPEVSFRAISSNGADLWAGGTGGALFHSADAGRTWTRVKIVDNGTPVSEMITGVNFLLPTTGTVTSASGMTWNTTDGGKTWVRRQ